VGAEAYAVLWHTLFAYKFYEYADNLSAAWIWSRIRRIGRSRYSLMREKLGFLEGGSATLLQAMKKSIEQHGGEFRLTQPVSHVKISDGQVKGVVVNGHFEAFASVISTIPLPYIPQIMPDLPKAILAQFAAVKNIAVVCVIVKLRRPVSQYFWVNVNDPDMDIPGFVEYTQLRPLQEPIVYVPFYMPVEQAKFADTDQVFKDKVQRYLSSINPDLQADDFIQLHVSRYRYAQPICPPGYLDTLPPVSLPVAGLMVADTSYYYPEDRGISESIAFGRNMARRAIA
jgi:protoporphyrinogen oxidase